MGIGGDRVEVAIVGAGFSGLAMGAALQDAGIDDFVILERAGDIGGTWRDNAYPGCACDVPSHLYSFSFAPNPDWSSTFSPQAEIQAYLRKVARERGLFAKTRLDCELQRASWDAHSQRWVLQTSQGTIAARVLVAAAGPLSSPSVPKVPGLERFTGTVFHSAAWNHEHDLSGERVAVVGTGASSIQFVPQIQPAVAKLYVFQRTPPWIMPRRARRLTRLERALYRRSPAAQRAMRDGIYWARELYAIPLIRASLSPITRRMGLANIRRHVHDPALRERITPAYAPGCKRVLISSDYLPSLSKPNVEVVAGGVEEVRQRSVVTSAGLEIAVDTIIFGTGFHVTDVPIAACIIGASGETLRDAWAGGMEAYLGTAVAGFPNLFFLLGPNTGLGHTSVVLMAEWQAAYVAQAVVHMRRRGLAELEVRRPAQAVWNRQVQRRMRNTVWLAGGCSSWYLDSHGRNTTLWPDFTFRFRTAVRRFQPQDYDGRPAVAAPQAEPQQAAA